MGVAELTSMLAGQSSVDCLWLSQNHLWPLVIAHGFPEMSMGPLRLSMLFSRFKGPNGRKIGIATATAFLPAIAALVVATVLERIKRENDLVTYREILAFMNGETDIKRDPRAPPRRSWPTKHRLAYDLLTFFAAALIGGALGFAVWGLLN